jgi:hypothetical protein
MIDVTATEEDVMQQTWACLTCQTTFRYGQIRMRRGGLGCPNCDDDAGLQPADGRSVAVDEYHGPVGALN